MEGKYIEHLTKKLENLFLHTTFSDIKFLKGEIAKHLDIPESSILLREERNVTNEEGKVEYSLYTLKLYDFEFVLRFNHKIKPAKEIDVPRVVKNDNKRWWKVSEPDTKVVIEKQTIKEQEYWLLAAISNS